MQRFILIIIFTCIITSLSALDYYWVGGSGDWSDINHWAKSSGGSVKHLQVPTPSDNVYFDANSFSAPGEVVNLNSLTITCNDFIIDQADSMVFKGIVTQMYVYGSFHLQKAMKWPSNIFIYMNSLKQGNTVFQAGNHSTGFYFEGAGGSWTIQDTLSADNIILMQGDLSFGAAKISCMSFNSSTLATRTLDLASSTIYLIDMTIQGANITVSPGQSRMIFRDYLTNNLTVYNSPQVEFYDVVFQNKEAYIKTMNNQVGFHDVEFKKNGFLWCNASFHDLIIHGDYMIHIEPNRTQEFSGDIITMTSCLDYVNIFCDSLGTDFVKNNGTLDVDYVRLKHIHGVGGASFEANNSFDLGGNQGWIFTTPAARTLYWVNGSGKWHDTKHWSLSSGGQAGECPPTFVDDVIIDAASGSCDTILINAASLTDSAQCHDFTWQNASCPIMAVRDSSAALSIHGSMYFDPGVKFYYSKAPVVFCSDDAGENINTGNIMFKTDIVFDGSGEWTLNDELKTEKNLSFTEGSLNTSSNYIRAQKFSSPVDKPRLFNLAGSVIDITGGDTSWYMVQENMLLNAGTSQINFLDSVSGIVNETQPAVNYHNVSFIYNHGENLLSNDNTGYHKVEIAGNALFWGECVVDSLMLNEDRLYEFQSHTKQTINDHLGAEGGCLGFITMQSHDVKEPAELFSSAPAINVHNVNMRNLHALGSATFVASNSIDNGFNQGWIFTPPTGIDHYWIGGSGDWSDTSHWSYSSGGPGGACLPTPVDDVYFDQNSFTPGNSNVNIDCFNALCRDMNWSSANVQAGITGLENKHLRIYGSLLFPDTFVNAYEGRTYFSSRDTGNVIKSSLENFKNEIEFNGRYGEWKLLDTLKNDSTIYHHAGFLNLNGNGLTAWKFISNYELNKSMDISDSYIRLTAKKGFDAFSMKCDSLQSFVSQNSLIETIHDETGVYTWGNGNIGYDKVLFSAKGKFCFITTETAGTYFRKATFKSHGEIWGANTFDSLVFSESKDYILERDITQTIVSDWVVPSNCDEYVSIQSELDGTAAQVMKINGDQSLQYVKLKDVHGIGNVNYYAYDCVDQGNNNGWQFSYSPPRQLYWVNGSGRWDTTYHWSLSSGGPGGECIPTKVDDVFFDANSFSGFVPDTVLLDSGECRNMDWTGAATKPLFMSSPFTDKINLNIYGSVTFIDSMELDVNRIHFRSDTLGETIESAGQAFNYVAFNEPGGEWNFLDNFKAKNTIRLYHGSVNTHGFNVETDTFDLSFTNPAALSLDSSVVTIRRIWMSDATNLNFDAGTSHLHFLDQSSSYQLLEMNLLNGGSQFFHNVTFTKKSTHSLLEQKNTQGYFNRLTMDTDAKILGRSVSDTLIFTPGHTYKLDHTQTQIINNHWQVRGNNCFSINLESTHKNYQAKVKKDTGIVSGDFINMRDIRAIGGAAFYAGNFSTDISNNDNWLFQNGPSYVYGLPDTTYFQIGGTATLSSVNFNGSASTLYQWSTGSSLDSIVVDSSGWYYVTVTYASNCIVEDSTYLDCMLDVDFLSTETSCFGTADGSAQIILPDTSWSYNFLWETGDTTQLLSGLHAGWYEVKVTANELCVTWDSALVQQPPPVEVPLEDTAFCETNDSLLLDAGSQFLGYQWHDGYTKQTRVVWETDTFILSVMDTTGCWSPGDTIVVSEDSVPKLELGDDKSLCLFETALIEALPGCDAYLWNTGSVKDQITVHHTGKYWVDVWKGSCMASDTITMIPCDPEFDIPNVFTPNGDGFNDRFAPVITNIIEAEMIIINRWGKEIFRTREMKTGWDGTINGRKCSEGVYYYVINYTEFITKQEQYDKSVSGSVTLLR